MACSLLRKDMRNVPLEIYDGVETAERGLELLVNPPKRPLLRHKPPAVRARSAAPDVFWPEKFKMSGVDVVSSRPKRAQSSQSMRPPAADTEDHPIRPLSAPAGQRHRDRRRLAARRVATPAITVLAPMSKHVIAVREKHAYTNPGAARAAVAPTAIDGLRRGPNRKSNDTKPTVWRHTGKLVQPRAPVVRKKTTSKPSGDDDEVSKEEDKLPLSVAKTSLYQLSVAGRLCFPQSSNVWYVRTRRLRVWMEEETLQIPRRTQPPLKYRPSAVLIFSSAGGLIAAEPLHGSEPAPFNADDMAMLLVDCFHKMKGAGGRASSISFDKPLVEATLGPSVLNKLGIGTNTIAPSDGLENSVLREFCRDLRCKLGDDKEVYDGPGMCTATASKPERVNRFFVSSADFYTGRPWEIVDSTGVFVIHFPSSKATRYFSVLGMHEKDQGLLMAYADQDLILMHKQRRDRELDTNGRAPQPHPTGLRVSHRPPLAVLFKPIRCVPFDVVEEVDMHDWLLSPGPQGGLLPYTIEYPSFRPLIKDEFGDIVDPATVDAGEDVLKPTTCKDDELKFFDIALRALPMVIKARLMDEPNPEPFRHMCHVATGDETMQCLVRYKTVTTFDFDLKPFDVNSIFMEPDEYAELMASQGGDASVS